MTDALVLTILGMGTVLVVLYTISLMIRVLSKIVGTK
jgi:Na+-transporting methylmalonyl-CoA/oxaloacetate decarboxylase gamma subunit